MEQNNDEKKGNLLQRIWQKYYIFLMIINFILAVVISIFWITDTTWEKETWELILGPIVIFLILFFPFIKGRIIGRFFNFIANLFKR